MARAYLHICIDTEVVPPVVNQVRIMSDANPTTQFSREMWICLLHMDGSDYQAAESNIIALLRRMPLIYGWMNPFFEGRLFPDMPPPESQRTHTDEPESQRVPGKPALERLGDLTFGDD